MSERVRVTQNYASHRRWTTQKRNEHTTSWDNGKSPSAHTPPRRFNKEELNAIAEVHGRMARRHFLQACSARRRSTTSSWRDFARRIRSFPTTAHQLPLPARGGGFCFGDQRALDVRAPSFFRSLPETRLHPHEQTLGVPCRQHEGERPTSCRSSMFQAARVHADAVHTYFPLKFPVNKRSLRRQFFKVDVTRVRSPRRLDQKSRASHTRGIIFVLVPNTGDIVFITCLWP